MFYSNVDTGARTTDRSLYTQAHDWTRDLFYVHRHTTNHTERPVYMYTGTTTEPETVSVYGLSLFANTASEREIKTTTQRDDN